MKPAPDPDTKDPYDALQRLDTIRMHSSDRAVARKQLIQSEKAVDFAFHVFRVLRTTAAAWKERLFAPADRQRDAYLSRAVDRIDLERRIRRLERHPAPFREGH